MCSSEEGFTLAEMIVGLCLAVLLALGLAPLYVSLQEQATAAHESAIRRASWEVARTRLARDLRQAGGAPDKGWGTNPVVSFARSEIVFLTRDARTGSSELVEWEIVGGSVMRRASPWTGPPPSSVSHSLYADHKTMMEGVERGEFTAIATAGVVETVGPVRRPEGIRGVDLALEFSRRSQRAPVLRPRLICWLGR